MSTTPEENSAAPADDGATTAAPTTRPRRRRAASRPAGPPVHVEAEVPEAAQTGAVAQTVGAAAAPAVETVVAPPVEQTPAPEAPVEVPAEEATPRRRTRRATRKTATPEVAPPVEVETDATPGATPEVPAEAAQETTVALDAPAPVPVAEEAAPVEDAPVEKAPRRRRARKTAAPAAVEPTPEPVEETPAEVSVAEVSVAEVSAVAEDAPVEEVPVEETTAPSTAPSVAEAATQPDLMDDPVLLRAAGLARGGRRERTAAERAEDAAARATALFFQAPDAEPTTRRSRRASAPAGPPPGQDGFGLDVESRDEGDDDHDSRSDRDHDDEYSRPRWADARDRDEDSDEASDDENDTDENDDANAENDDDRDDEGGAPRRRRRRGGRGRRSRTRDDSTDDSTEENASDDSDDSGSEDDDSEEGTSSRRDSRSRVSEGAEDEDEDSSGEDDNDTEDGEESGGSSRRRRRRRRRGGSADADEAGSDDPPNTVTRVREPRRQQQPAPRGTGEDEITALRGSTRLEAKKQRRREGREQGRKRAILTEAEFLARREAVERVMVVRQEADKTQIGVLEDGILVEHYGAKSAQTTMVGNVYLGRVQNVLPSMEAAFIDVGKGRNAVLYAGEVNWDAAGLEGQPRRIEAALKSGDPVLVQVTKDPVGHKGARLTSQVSLPGRYLVYVPRGSMTGISRKLPDTERARLKKVLKQVVPEGAGVIVRTAAEGVAEEELAADVQRLQATWEAIQAKAQSKNAPLLLHGEPDLTVRVVRDVFNEDFTRAVIAGDQAWDSVHGYVADVAPDLADRLERWEGGPSGSADVFEHFRIDEQLAKALGRKVWLPSGGSLVIDPTEAMHVVDVNTGKFTGAGGTLEETVTRNNLEAAEEIVRQLRLRDIGGIIVIDFIDMVLESNRDLVLRRLVECLGRDRTKHQVAEVTSLGLVQMTRKRTGQGLAAVLEELDAAADANPSPQPSPNQSGGGQSGGGQSGNQSGNQSGGGQQNSQNSSANGSGKSRSRRGRGRDRNGSDDATRAEEAPREQSQDAAKEPAREPGKDAGVLAAIAAVAAAGRREREAGEAHTGSDQGSSTGGA